MKKILCILLFFMIVGSTIAQDTLSDLKVIQSNNQRVLVHRSGAWVNDARDVIVSKQGIQQPKDKNLMVLQNIEGAGVYSLYLQRKNYWYLVKADIPEGFSASIEPRTVTSIIHIVYRDYSTEDISF